MLLSNGLVQTSFIVQNHTLYAIYLVITLILLSANVNAAIFSDFHE